LGSTRRIKALIFDFDGLIIDSESPGYQAWSEVYAVHGCDLPFEKYSNAIGTINGFDPASYLEELTGSRLDKPALETRCGDRWRELMKTQKVLPGIVGCLDAASASGLALAVASSSTREWVSEHLARVGLLERFSVLCCRDEVASVKPAPDLYLLALEKLGVQADEAIAFEDSPNGILAAKRAGLFCVAIPNPLTVRLPLDRADRLVPSMQAMNLVELLKD
jgi:HAD superfamily hydrolase (TIGR01509 family)